MSRMLARNKSMSTVGAPPAPQSGGAAVTESLKICSLDLHEVGEGRVHLRRSESGCGCGRGCVCVSLCHWPRSCADISLHGHFFCGKARASCVNRCWLLLCGVLACHCRSLFVCVSRDLSPSIHAPARCGLLVQLLPPWPYIAF